jgi:putative tryptophan/tyrosine transport system substrate-binding protein
VTGLSRRQLVQSAGAIGLGLLAGCGRLPGQGQPPAPARVPRIGYLALSRAPGYAEAFQRGLAALGYVEGQNIITEYRFGVSEGRLTPLQELAAELVSLPVDVIVGAQGDAVSAARAATTTIPIIMLTSGDPLAAGTVPSLARPGGNVTGLSMLTGALAAKRLDLLKQALPSLSRVAALLEPSDIMRRSELRPTQDAADALAIEVQPVEVGAPTELEPAFAAMSGQGIEALVVFSHGFAIAHRAQITALAAAHRLPAIYGVRVMAASGGLMVYGPPVPDAYYRAATYVDKILKGAKPGDLPIEQPMRFDFVINLKTAQALGLTIPHHVLLQATEVIQ